MSKVLAASFAQMLGIRPKSKGARAEDDEDKEKDAKGSRAEGDTVEDEDEDKGSKGSKGSRAEDEDGDDADASRADNDDEDAEDEDDEKKAKGARADDEEDDDAAEDEGGDEGDEKKGSKATKAERDRCARIIAHGIKLGSLASVKQAGVFAFDTGMSSRAAIAALDAGADVSERNPKASGLRERMASAKVEKPGSGSASAAAPSLADQIIAAGKARRGEQ